MTEYADEITDGLGVADTGTNNWNGRESISSESLVLADSQAIGWPKSLTESLDLTDTLVFMWMMSTTDTFFIYDNAQNGWIVVNTSDLVLTDTMSISLGIAISDWLTLIDSQTNNWNGKEVHTDTLMIYDLCQGGKVFYDTLNESLVATDTNLLKLTVSILEYLGFTELVSAIKTCANSINDSLILTDSADRGFTFAITEALSAVDTLSVVTTFLGAISESLVLADTVSFIKKIYPSISESLVFAETVSNKGTFYDAVYDTLAMNVIIELNGEVYECYVLNTPKFMPSMYSGFGFNSYCVFENRSFGADDTGIYELTGSTDNGSQIHTGVILSETDFGSPNKKRFRRGYLGTSGDSPVMVFEAEDGSRQAYNIDAQGKVVASSELKSKKWVLSVADFDTLETIKLIPVILTK